MKKTTKIVFLLVLGFLLTSAGYVAASGDLDDFDIFRRRRTFTVEIAENGTRFLPDAEPSDADGIPLYGSEFITQGYIYPEGTITCDSDNNCNGVNPDGSPEFPELVLGLWTCRGWHVNDGATTTSGPIVITTQNYAFGDNPTSQNITTDGFELADFNLEFKRSIVGGTGRYQKARGTQYQELLGWNPSVGVALSVTFDVKR